MSYTLPRRIVDSTQSYQSLFQISSVLPRFVISYRWWEDEAATVLWAFNIPEICRVIRFGLFRDGNFARRSLMNRNADVIDTFLIALSDPKEHELLENLSHMQKVEEILRRSTIPPYEPQPWTWFPPPPGHSLDAHAVADAIEAESHFQFTKIAFEELIRACLGYNTSSIEWFLLQHTVLYTHLLNHLQIYPEEIPLYIEVEKHLRTHSPFAHKAVVHSIFTVQLNVTHDIPRPATLGFEFIAGPVQRLFKDQPPSLTTILKIFSVLAVRFRGQYIHTAKMDWHRPFDTKIQFFEDFLNSTSPKDLARILTGADEKDFSELSRQSVTANDAFVRGLVGNWRTLCISVWECCSALPDIAQYLRECAEVLLSMRNYHSFTALLDGLHRYNLSSARPRSLNNTVVGMVVLDALLPPDAIILTDPTQNYANYRQHYREYPGVPFLIPHLRDYQQNGETAIQPLLQYLQNSP